MYHISFYEDGRFLTELGGPIKTLPEALSQIENLVLGQAVDNLEDYVGCKWVRAGSTPCHILVVDDFGHPIRTEKDV